MQSTQVRFLQHGRLSGVAWTVWEQAKCFLRSFFADDDVDIVRVCELAQEYADIMGEQDNTGSKFEAGEGKLIDILHQAGKGLSVVQFRRYLEKLNPGRDHPVATFLEFCMYFFGKSTTELFTRTADRDPTLLTHIRFIEKSIQEASSEKAQMEAEVAKLQQEATGTNLYKANRDIDNLNKVKIPEVEAKMSSLESMLEDGKTEYASADSKLDVRLIEMKLHEKYPMLFDVL